LPDRETLLAFLREAGEAQKADIARAFGLKGADRRSLRLMLKDLEAEGALGRRGRRGFAGAGDLPPVGVADVVERDADGDLYVRLVKAGDDAPLARLAPDKREAVAGAPGIGDRVLVRFERGEERAFEAKLIKRLGQSAHRILGVVRKARREVRVEPVDRKSRESLLLTGPEAEALRDGDLVLATVSPGGGDRHHGPKRGQLLEVLGREDQPRAASLIAIHAHGIPTGFPEAAEAEAAAAKAPTLAGRTDLRDLPLVTIDPPDARDHDDAVYAHPDEITPAASSSGSPSPMSRRTSARARRSTRRRGTRATASTSPTASNPCCRTSSRADSAAWWRASPAPASPCGWCSTPRGARPATASSGPDALRRQAVLRAGPGRRRRAARRRTGPLLPGVLEPLWAAYRLMLKGRLARSPLDIATLERRIVLNARARSPPSRRAPRWRRTG
jgi:ribonuclease R